MVLQPCIRPSLATKLFIRVAGTKVLTDPIRQRKPNHYPFARVLLSSAAAAALIMIINGNCDRNTEVETPMKPAIHLGRLRDRSQPSCWGRDDEEPRLQSRHDSDANGWKTSASGPSSPARGGRWSPSPLQRNRWSLRVTMGVIFWHRYRYVVTNEGSNSGEKSI